MDSNLTQLVTKFLPKGIFSTKQGCPEWGTSNRYQASIYGGHYLFSPHKWFALEIFTFKEKNRVDWSK